MEFVRSQEDIVNLKDNKIFGEPNLTNTTIKFGGVNNILVCEGDINLTNANISFSGSNSIIYLSYSQLHYRITIVIRNNSTLFIGKNNKFGVSELYVEEHQNLIIGDDCLIGSAVTIKTSELYPEYDLDSKNRVNFSKSVLIGDHVWIGNQVFISKGTQIGSGAIIGSHSYIPPASIIHSNTHVQGNPIRTIRNNVFFTKDFLGSYTEEDTLNYSTYKSNIFKYEYVQNETLSFNKIDEILNNLTVIEKLDFINKLFIKNKRKNRFFY
ncbi:hypothetical protein TL18_08620 [Methanobrevibacter sp. YE315]|uniref:acyltransferase n=1 Tax=Methanobrevibacter sp. YE315 TaxID=1609968 RepID=UPI000764CFA3|nr:hypothetical protein [Methanobrevibacter sp. YE315]AMD18074.1 hypothetical protein TL18_08620 [Methanobrevibacter sp. YE315]